jgi:hypothetical protein
MAYYVHTYRYHAFRVARRSDSQCVRVCACVIAVKGTGAKTLKESIVMGITTIDVAVRSLSGDLAREHSSVLQHERVTC